MTEVTTSATTAARHPTLAEFVVVELRRRIVLGMLPPGSRLEVEKISAELGSSRIPVREAVRQLEAEGLVVSIPRRGVVVSAVDPQDIDDAYQLLEAVELLAAERAAASIDAETLGRMRRYAAEMARLADQPRSEAMLDAHRSFHFAMFESAGGGVLLRHLRMLWYACERFVAGAMHDPGRSASSAQEHEELIAMLERHDVPGVTRLIRQHLRASRERAHRRFG